MTVVSDYTALYYHFPGYTWWGGALPGRPVFLTYSFETTAQSYFSTEFSAEFISSFKPFTASDQQLAREALLKWANASGIQFFEVPAGHGDIAFGKYNFDFHPHAAGARGSAYFPELSIDPNNPYEFLRGGDVQLNWKSPTELNVLMHEIGHALGLKHPFEDDPILASHLDNTSNTLMSYTGPEQSTLGPLDIQAIQYLYGPPSADGTQVASWSWDSNTYTLTQVGHDGGDTIRGMRTNDVIVGGNWNDLILGYSGDDRLTGRGGNDTVVGGNGNDTVVFSGARGDYHVDAMGGGTFKVTDRRSGVPDGADTVSSVETFSFLDGNFTPANVLGDPTRITSNSGGDSAVLFLVENRTFVTTVTAVDWDSASPTYAIVGGADASKFQINASTGALSLIEAPDFESRKDSDGNNSYVVQVRAASGGTPILKPSRLT
ncbi:MAG: matrixin family metalloprotease [Xanthobacteraceae bacterium]